MNKFLAKKENKILFYFILGFEFLHFLTLFLVNYLAPLNKLYRFDNDSWGILRAFGNFDGFHYHHIAKEGYGLFQQAFFPFYPILIRLTSQFTNTYFINGLIISNASFILFLFVFFDFLNELFDKKTSLWAILFLLLFPTSFFLTSYYTESLFLFLFISCIYSLKKEKYLSSAVFGYLSALTRFIGIALFIPILIYLILEKKKIGIKQLLVLFSPILGFLSYSFYLFKTKGDFLFFITAQPNFGANRSDHLILFPQVIYRYLKIIATFKMDFTYFIAILEFSIFLVFICGLLWQLRWIFKNKKKLEIKKTFSILLGINIFSLSNLILPTLSGSFSSVPRYVLLSISFFMVLGTIKSNIIKVIIGMFFLILHLLLFTFFLRGYFIS